MSGFTIVYTSSNILKYKNNTLIMRKNIDTFISCFSEFNKEKENKSADAYVKVTCYHMKQLLPVFYIGDA